MSQSPEGVFATGGLVHYMALRCSSEKLDVKVISSEYDHGIYWVGAIAILKLPLREEEDREGRRDNIYIYIFGYQYEADMLNYIIKPDISIFEK